MAVCVRGSVLVFYAVFAGGGQLFVGGGGTTKNMGGAFFRVGRG